MSISEHGFKPVEVVPERVTGRPPSVSKPIIDAFLASGETCVMREFADKRAATKLYIALRHWLRRHPDAPAQVTRRGCSIYLVRTDRT